MLSYGKLRRVALVRTDVSEELSASFIRVTRIGELGKTLAISSQRTSAASYSQRCSHFTDSCHRDEGGAKLQLTSTVLFQLSKFFRFQYFQIISEFRLHLFTVVGKALAIFMNECFLLVAIFRCMYEPFQTQLLTRMANGLNTSQERQGNV
jgi:hypothetical protein